MKAGQIGHTKKVFLEALQKSMGVVTAACQVTDIAPSTIYHWINTDPVFGEAVQDVSEVALDFVESKLLEQVSKGKCDDHYLSPEDKGKHRG